MTPTRQTRFGHGKGDCLLACVASILNRPINEIPDFTDGGDGWYGRLYDWCIKENIGLITVSPNDWEHSLCFNSWCILLYTVHGIDAENHAVIGKCQRTINDRPDTDDASWHWEAKVEFDPNPNGVKINNLEHIIFLIPNQ